jgi:hypothetical protein
LWVGLRWRQKPESDQGAAADDGFVTWAADH